MKIRVDQITEDGCSLIEKHSAAHFPALREIEADQECSFRREINVEVKVKRYRKTVTVKGEVRSRLRQTCSRCLEFYECIVPAKLSLTYVPENKKDNADNIPENGDIQGIEDCYYYDGFEVDLTEAVQENLVMALPFQPVCRENCKGLCPECGMNLNDNDCGCDRMKADPRFAVLKNIKLNQDS